MAVPAVALVASLAEEVASWANPPSAIIVVESVAMLMRSDNRVLDSTLLAVRVPLMEASVAVMTLAKRSPLMVASLAANFPSMERLPVITTSPDSETTKISFRI
ncbi:MAG: hypothetical protein UT14_C0033G0015 [Candidatus Shapirobacteria bacterium GW2011_GWE1_38_92]|uniref:Uncharacterized protein n=1 Tax=Candidatus Shapirobacteria bacterium GW2011_GWE1_38_92 TaxID=1618489 RepID=A0A0G0LRN4_9BACT|nr:MAG: hypothetical protein UT14_C0033G0015 [Candidatus Shapirobacteria bacterium GW2011_GWE1_38_92]